MELYTAITMLIKSADWEFSLNFYEDTNLGVKITINGESYN